MTSTRCLPLNDNSLAEAADILRAGDVVAFPTETVYGLGADAAQPEAVRRIFDVKGRPADHPVIVHVADGDDPLRWAATWTPLAKTLADAFWPGPLTLIVPRRQGVSDLVTGGQDTVGIRCPGHVGAQQLLKAFGGGLAAPSANRFGRISPTCAAHVMEELGGRIPLVLDGGDAPVGIESTIIDVSRGYPVLLRPGHLSAREIERVLNQRLARSDAKSPRVSGALDSHYAPVKPLQWVAPVAMSDVLRSLTLTGGNPVVVLCWSASVSDAAGSHGLTRVSLDVLHPAQQPELSTNLTPAALTSNGTSGFVLTLPDDPHALAHHLYAALRWADHLPVKTILIEQPPTEGVWEGVADRLRRAAAGHAR